MFTNITQPMPVSNWWEGKQIAEEYFKKAIGFKPNEISVNGYLTEGGWEGKLFEASIESHNSNFYFTII